jgi:hypothetical protein
MATPTEAFVLVDTGSSKSQPHFEENTSIERIIRTYYSKSRAEKDMELLLQTTSNAYRILTIEHIDD